MNKKLKIQFWKAEKALAMQILEQEGLPKRKNEGNVRVWDYIALFKEAIVLGGINEFDLHIPHIIFDTNAERDAYLDKVINAITDELFIADEKLEFNKPCKVDNNITTGKFELAIYLGKLRLNDKWYYITKPFDEDSSNPNMLKAWSVVSPVKTCRGPIKEEFGPVVTYTWEKIYGSYDTK